MQVSDSNKSILITMPTVLLMYVSVSNPTRGSNHRPPLFAVSMTAVLMHNGTDMTHTEFYSTLGAVYHLFVYDTLDRVILASLNDVCMIILLVHELITSSL